MTGVHPGAHPPGASTHPDPPGSGARQAGAVSARQPGLRKSTPTISVEPFGALDDVPVYRYTLTAPGGTTIALLTYGGILQSFHVPDQRGDLTNVALGFPTLDGYLRHNSPAAGGGVYFGALIGRYANRIAHGTFTLDGTAHRIPVNDKANALHGGTSGFDQKIWTPTVQSDEDSVSLTLHHLSPDGDMGFPGTLTTHAIYTLDSSGRLTIAFHATTDKPTVVNLTSHAYWNLAGEHAGSVYDHTLQLNAASYTPVDAAQTPTGAILPVAGTPYDFTRPTPIGARIAHNDPQLLIGQGYDLNWVLDRPIVDAAGFAARAVDPGSGRTLTMSTTQPGVQFYSGNYLTGILVGSGDAAYRQSQGFALEPQHFPDSPNHSHFPSTVLLPGETYQHATIYEVFQT